MLLNWIRLQCASVLRRAEERGVKNALRKQDPYSVSYRRALLARQRIK